MRLNHLQESYETRPVQNGFPTPRGVELPRSQVKPMVNRQTKKQAEDSTLKTGDLKIDFDKKASRFSWVSVLLLIVSLYVFLFLPLSCYFVSVRPNSDDNKETPTTREQRKP